MRVGQERPVGAEAPGSGGWRAGRGQGGGVQAEGTANAEEEAQTRRCAATHSPQAVFQPTLITANSKSATCELSTCERARQPPCASCCTVLLYFSRDCTVRLRMFSLFFVFVFYVRIVCVKSIINLSQYSTLDIYPIVLVGYLG